MLLYRSQCSAANSNASPHQAGCEEGQPSNAPNEQRPLSRAFRSRAGWARLRRTPRAASLKTLSDGTGGAAPGAELTPPAPLRERSTARGSSRRAARLPGLNRGLARSVGPFLARSHPLRWEEPAAVLPDSVPTPGATGRVQPHAAGSRAGVRESTSVQGCTVRRKPRSREGEHFRPRCPAAVRLRGRSRGWRWGASCRSLP